MTKKEEVLDDFEYQDFADDYDYFDNRNSLSEHCCCRCGIKLTQGEFEEFEAECYDCMWGETSGLIEDSGEELNFEK